MVVDTLVAVAQPPGDGPALQSGKAGRSPDASWRDVARIGIGHGNGTYMGDKSYIYIIYIILYII